MEENKEPPSLSRSNLDNRKSFTIAGVLAVVFVVFVFFFAAPFSFPMGAIIEIPSGATLTKTSHILKEKNAIHSSMLFRAYITFFESGKKVVAGKYLFSEKESLFLVAERITSGDYRIPQIRVTFPEGSTVFDMAKIMKASASPFDDVKFLSLAKGDEGFLFPDTYFFSSIITPEETITAMKENFRKKIAPLEKGIKASGRTLQDSVIMASLIERETITPEDRRIVSGILWKRIKLGMPLQVDAAFNYVNGKSTYDLTADDLKIDSRYNTYKYKGLPRGPIANPGLDAIIASLEPSNTQYLYYLSEKSGAMHYAKTFEEHKKNKAKYLTR